MSRLDKYDFAKKEKMSLTGSYSNIATYGVQQPVKVAASSGRFAPSSRTRSRAFLNAKKTLKRAHQISTGVRFEKADIAERE
ncbi:hypothetical protein ACFWVB_31870 [Streptomyces microflavus]|uniref:hypothetical protein n=1 Tax=Streptomyces microflavus TaxID=1919 RepID=UPI0036504E69